MAKNYENDFGAGQPPQWGFSESPLVMEIECWSQPGGSKGAMVALDRKTGNVIWQSKDFTDAAHYSSIVTAEIGRRASIRPTHCRQCRGHRAQGRRRAVEGGAPGPDRGHPTSDR